MIDIFKRPTHNIASTWNPFFDQMSQDKMYKRLDYFLNREYQLGKIVYPPSDAIFKAFEYTPIDAVKCVIIGQDPYHGEGQAMGLAFSVNKGVTIPRSLKNIYKELNAEFGYRVPAHGDLTHWVKQGVLLLNAVLTVRKNEPASHARR